MCTYLKSSLKMTNFQLERHSDFFIEADIHLLAVSPKELLE